MTKLRGRASGPAIRNYSSTVAVSADERTAATGQRAHRSKPDKRSSRDIHFKFLVNLSITPFRRNAQGALYQKNETDSALIEPLRGYLQ
jgi:hypothetical protein